MPEVWSSTNFPYVCLKDRRRTEAFRKAIHEVVHPGDVVVEAGAGTGILSFFAAEAGARAVYAVEIDPLLAAYLETSVARNGLGEVVTVVAGDATTVELPQNVDVFIAELIDTALMDEMQAEVVNAMRDRGVIGAATRVLPETISTFAELVELDDRFFGFRIASPKHEWPMFATQPEDWLPTRIEPLTDRAHVATADFRAPVDPSVSSRIRLTGQRSGLANGIRLTGESRLSPNVTLGATNALLGDKILDAGDGIPVATGEAVELHLDYRLGGGMGSFRYAVLSRATI